MVASLDDGRTRRSVVGSVATIIHGILWLVTMIHGWCNRRMEVVCDLMWQIVSAIVKCLSFRTWGTVRNISYFVDMEKYLQQVSHSLVSQGE